MAGVLDRIRGTNFDILQHRLFDKLAYGWCIALLLGCSGWSLIFVALLFAVGISIALSEPIGAALSGRPMNPAQLEWYQVGPFKHHAWLALILRGALTGSPLALVWYVPGIWTIPAAYMAAFPLAVLVARFLPARLFPAVFPERWASQEYLRGWIAAALIVVMLHA